MTPTTATRTATARIVSLGGRRVPVHRPRMRASTARVGSRWRPTACLRRRVPRADALDRMLAGLSTRRYSVGLDRSERRREGRRGTSRSAVSRHRRQTRPPWPSCCRDLSCLDLVAFMVDGVRFGEHTCVALLRSTSTAPSTRCHWSRASTKRHPRHRTDRRAARARAGRHPPDPGGARRVEGAAPRGPGCVRPAGDRPLPTPQDL